MKIDLIPEWALSPADEAQIADLLAAAFDTDFGGRTYYMQRHHLRLVLRDPEIVGHIALLFRAVRQGDQHITIAGLAEVATAPTRRGEGIATRLLRRAVEVSRSSPAEHILLFGDAPIYAGHGFRPVQNPLTFLAIDQDDQSTIHNDASDSLMVLDLSGKPWDGQIPTDLIGRKF